MAFAQIVISFVLLVFVIRRWRDEAYLRSIILFFVVLYAIQLELAIIDPYGYHKIGLFTIILFNMQIIFFIFGASSALPRKIKKIYNVNIKKVFEFRCTSFLIFVQTVVLILALNKYRKVSAFVTSMGGATKEARDFYFREMYGSYTEMFLYQIFDSFIILSYFFIFSPLFLSKRDRSYKRLYLSLTGILIIILNTLSSLGRGVIFSLLVVFVLFLLYSYYNDKDVFSKRVKPIGLIVLGLVFSGIIVSTMMRMNLTEYDVLLDNFSEMLIKSFVVYFYVPICAFDFGKDYIFNDLIPMLGAADLSWIIDVFLTPIQFIDHSFPSINSILGSKMSPIFIFPSGESWNALFTGGSNYYIDFGFLGFIIFPYIHGFLIARITKRSLSSGLWFVVLIFLFSASYQHLSSLGVQSISTSFFVMWIFLLYKNRVFSIR